MPYPQKNPLRPFTEEEGQALSQIAKASSERVDVVRRAKALLAVGAGNRFPVAARQSGFQSADSVSQLVERFNQQGLAALSIAAGRGRKPTYTSQERQCILEELRREPDREQDQSATWSLKLLERSLRRQDLPSIGASTIRRVLHEAGYAFGRTRTWCTTGTALRKRKAGVVTVHDPQTEEKKRLIELAYLIGEPAGIQVWCQDEAGPYQAIPQPGVNWHPIGLPKRLPHEYIREGTAKLLTLFRPRTGQVRAHGVLSAPNAVLHPWLKAELSQVLEPIKRREEETGRPIESERPVGARWRTWLWPHENDEGLPPLRILLVWDNLAGHLIPSCDPSENFDEHIEASSLRRDFSFGSQLGITPDLVGWLFQQGIMPLYTPLGGSWLNMAESIQNVIVPRALAGQHPQSPQQIIDWLEQTVDGWNQKPTPFVWAGKRKQRRERAKLRRLAGSGAALAKGTSIVA